MRLFFGILDLFDSVVSFMLRVELLRLFFCIGVSVVCAGLAQRIRKMTV